MLTDLERLRSEAEELREESKFNTAFDRDPGTHVDRWPRATAEGECEAD